MTDKINLPTKYHILPYSIDFRIPNFDHQYSPNDKVLSLFDGDCESWFMRFVSQVEESIGCEYLPICRMSDGEFLFALKEQPPSIRHSWSVLFKKRVKYILDRLFTKILSFRHQVGDLYMAGDYTGEEWEAARMTYGDLIQRISVNGILAIHFEYGIRPFQEHYFPALKFWMEDNSIELTCKNYVPFYFVYALLSGPERVRILRDRKILVVHSATGSKRDKIISALEKENVKDIIWYPISSSRSLFDVIDLQKIEQSVDLALVGAGVGKPSIISQLEPLKIPCIDAGYMFEVWSNPLNGKQRPFCEFEPMIS